MVARDFIDYIGMGVVNQDRVQFDGRKEEEGQPEPPKRSKQECVLFRKEMFSIAVPLFAKQFPYWEV